MGVQCLAHFLLGRAMSLGNRLGRGYMCRRQQAGEGSRMTDLSTGGLTYIDESRLERSCVSESPSLLFAYSLCCIYRNSGYDPRQ